MKKIVTFLFIILMFVQTFNAAVFTQADKERLIQIEKRLKPEIQGRANRKKMKAAL